ncbi:MAG: hypothetical protein IJ165_04080 [Proteobacteria bacterium]|nr:hypothetical protein [Pseudomonadota bacterium]
MTSSESFARHASAALPGGFFVLPIEPSCQAHDPTVGHKKKTPEGVSMI